MKPKDISDERFKLILAIVRDKVNDQYGLCGAFVQAFREFYGNEFVYGEGGISAIAYSWRYQILSPYSGNYSMGEFWFEFNEEGLRERHKIIDQIEHECGYKTEIT